MNTEKMQYKPESARGYIIALNIWHSRLALFSSLITVCCSLYAIIGSIVISVEAGQSVKDYFQWFTANSNCLTAFSAFMIIPFAAEGIRKKHFSYPKWVAMFHYSGTVCRRLKKRSNGRDNKNKSKATPSIIGANNEGKEDKTL